MSALSKYCFTGLFSLLFLSLPALANREGKKEEFPTLFSFLYVGAPVPAKYIPKSERNREEIPERILFYTAKGELSEGKKEAKTVNYNAVAIGFQNPSIWIKRDEGGRYLDLFTRVGPVSPDAKYDHCFSARLPEGSPGALFYLTSEKSKKPWEKLAPIVVPLEVVMNLPEGTQKEVVLVVNGLKESLFITLGDTRLRLEPMKYVALPVNGSVPVVKSKFQILREGRLVDIGQGTCSLPRKGILNFCAYSTPYPDELGYRRSAESVACGSFGLPEIPSGFFAKKDTKKGGRSTEVRKANAGSSRK